jgi:hypothetical protein
VVGNRDDRSAEGVALGDVPALRGVAPRQFVDVVDGGLAVLRAGHDLEKWIGALRA